MHKVKFWKMSGAGNDFILLEGGRSGASRLRRLALRLCSRRLSIGADGLLAVSRAGPGAVRVRYFNSDGSEAFCGNGTRCAAWWAFSRGWAGKKMVLKTAAGELGAGIVSRGQVKLAMPEVRGASLAHKGKYPAGVRAVHFLDTGVPHAVVPVKSLSSIEVEKLGRALRHNPAFGRAGANVNFVQVRGGAVHVRTYERGVEAETLACGTGITASAVALALSGSVRPPVTLIARSGERFKVWLKPADGGASGIVLQGPAEITFAGQVAI